MTSRSKVVSRYAVSSTVFKEIFNYGSGSFMQGKQSGWRKFYSSITTNFKLVTRTNKVNKSTINITARHSHVHGRPWCKASYNFVTKFPLDRDDSEVDFRMSIYDLELCDCGKLLWML